MILNQKKGKFDDKEKENFYNSFHQALIIPILENSPNDLDLSTNKDFKIGGKYVDNENKINQDIPVFFEDVQKLFFEAQDTNGNLINSKYRLGYFTIFSLGAESYDRTLGQIASEITVDSAGVSRMVFIKNLILFPLRDFCTMNHEGLHGFNVKHTH